MRSVCTILLFWGAKAKPLRLTLPRPLYRGALVLAGLFLLIQLGALLLVLTHLKEIGELYSLRHELAIAREQKTALLKDMTGIKQEVLTIKHLNWRFGVMLGQETDGSENSSAAKGGDEEISGPPQPSAMIDQELAWLKSEAAAQETLLNRNVKLAQEKSVRWASTPTIRPVKGPITSGFGERISPFSGEPAQHNGVDIGAQTNTPILAPATGRVTVVRYDLNMGNVVKIDHGFGYQTEYRHLQRSLVREGQRVKRGVVIGLVGNTGERSTGPHLHYQVFVKDRPVNPIDFFLD